MDLVLKSDLKFKAYFEDVRLFSDISPLKAKYIVFKFGMNILIMNVKTFMTFHISSIIRTLS